MGAGARLPVQKSDCIVASRNHPETLAWVRAQPKDDCLRARTHKTPTRRPRYTSLPGGHQEVERRVRE